MKLNKAIQGILSKKFEPSAMVYSKFKNYDLGIKTDREGNPILLFLGKMDRKGIIKGERFTRILKKDSEGNIIKDHWDLKGKAG